MTYEVGSVFVSSVDGNLGGTSFLSGVPSHKDCSLFENCHCRPQNVKLVKNVKIILGNFFVKRPAVQMSLYLGIGRHIIVTVVCVLQH